MSSMPPLITFALIVYNQERFIEDALAGALAQTYPHLEILVSDDASTDRTYKIAHAYLTKHDLKGQVTLLRQPKNLGLIGNVNYVLYRAQGELVVIAAGDDISAPERVAQLYKTYAARSLAPSLMHSSVRAIGLHNNDIEPPLRVLTDLEAICRCTTGYIGATGAFHPELWRFFGPIAVAEAYEDLVFVFRAALLNGIAYIDEPLVTYRVGAGITTKVLRRRIRDHYARHRRFRVSTYAVYEQRLRDLRVFRQNRQTNNRPAEEVLARCQVWLEDYLCNHAESARFYSRPVWYMLCALVMWRLDKLRMSFHELQDFVLEYARHRLSARRQARLRVLRDKGRRQWQRLNRWLDFR